MPPQSIDPFFTFAQQAQDGEFDLAHGALLIARQAYPNLDIESYLRQLDNMSQNYRAQHPPAANIAAELANLSHFIFVDLEFCGNQEAYDDPRNSYLNDVIDRRLGIPISLSMIYLEVGRRLGLPLAGVNFPYHFLVRSTESDSLFIDPFAGGVFVDYRQLGERLPVVDGRKIALENDYLAPAPPLQILARMLRNLKRIHVQERKFAAAVYCAEKISWIQPDEANNYRDLGFLYYWIHEYRKAINAFTAYLRWADDPSDTAEIQRNIRAISDRLSMLN